MDKLCEVFREQTPALTCHYRLQTAIVKSAKEKTPMVTMNKEGSITLPLLVVAGAVILIATPCIFHCCKCKKRKMQCACD